MITTTRMMDTLAERKEEGNRLLRVLASSTLLEMRGRRDALSMNKMMKLTRMDSQFASGQLVDLLLSKGMRMME